MRPRMRQAIPAPAGVRVIHCRKSGLLCPSSSIIKTSAIRRCLSKVLRNAKPATLFKYIQPLVILAPLAPYSFPALSILVASFTPYYLLYMLNNPFNPGLNTLLSEVFVPVMLPCLNSLSPTLWGSLFGCFSLYPELIRFYYIKIRGITWLKEAADLVNIVYTLLSVISVCASLILLNKRI